MSLPREGVHAACWLAWQAMRGGRLDDAQVVLDGLVVLDPNDREIAGLRCECALRRRDATRALDAAEHWRRVAPREGAASRAVARALILAGRHEEAYPWVRHAAELADPIARRWARRVSRQTR